jgi:hypothetical protein
MAKRRGKKGHFDGGKMTGSHGSSIDAADPVIRQALRDERVTNITASIIKCIGNGKKRIKFKDVDAGLRAMIRGGTHIQEVFFHCAAADRDGVRAALLAAFN